MSSAHLFIGSNHFIQALPGGGPAHKILIPADEVFMTERMFHFEGFPLRTRKVINDIFVERQIEN